MAADRTWQISEPQKLAFEAPLNEVHIRVVNGTVNVVSTDEDSARLEIAEMHGPPLTVRHEGDRLVVAYDDLPWQGFLKWLDRKGWNRAAVISVSVPAGVRLSVGVVGASAVVSGIGGRTDVRGVSGDVTLVGLTGDVRADTVSGGVETQALGGSLRMNSVSGDLTVMDGGGGPVTADSVSGDMIVDLGASSGAANVSLTTVSGEVAVRLPDPADARVAAGTASGSVFSAFDRLRAVGQWGAKSVNGVLGTGSGRLRVTTVSGPIALLRRPPDGADGPDAPPHAATVLGKDA